MLDRITQRGQLHEERFLEALEADGVEVVRFDQDPGLPLGQRLAEGRDLTLDAMRAGADVIYQAVLFDGKRLGSADFLMRIPQPSGLGDWSYEVWDTKLARHAKASAVLQLCMYSELLSEIQGRAPAQMHLALGGVQRETVSFRFADYAAYHRLVAREFEATLNGTPVYPPATAPEPVEHCAVCRWSSECSAWWRAQDDLSLVANLRSRQRHALHDVGVTTRSRLAEPLETMDRRPEGVGREALERVHAQARIQVEGEQAGEMLSERLVPPRDRDGALISNHGLLMLPEPSEGDLFFDIEGDPFFSSDEVDGIEYLFGVIEPCRANESGVPAFHAFWSTEGGTVTTGGERRAFEGFIDLVMERLATDPNLHIYHYAPYEPTAVKRLAGRHGTREEDVDRLLRGGVFVDLHRAVRQGIQASVESYSIKRLEPLYGFAREVDLRDAGSSIVEFETWLELGQDEGREELLKKIEEYNRDDCVSTMHLRDWLEGQRDKLEDELGPELPRPSVTQPEETEDTEAQKAVNALVDALTSGPARVHRGDGRHRKGSVAAGAAAELAPAGGEVLLVALLLPCQRAHRRGALRGVGCAGHADLPRILARPGASGPLYHPPVQVPAPGTRDQSRQPAPRSRDAEARRDGLLPGRRPGRDRHQAGQWPSRSDRHVPGPVRLLRSWAQAGEPAAPGPVGAGPRHGKPRRVPGGSRPAWASIAQVRWFRGTGTPGTRRDDGGRCPPDCLVPRRELSCHPGASGLGQEHRGRPR